MSALIAIVARGPAERVVFGLTELSKAPPATVDTSRALPRLKRDRGAFRHVQTEGEVVCQFETNQTP